MKTNIQPLSKTPNLRLYIIEHTIHIEALISEAIGALLNIEYKKSKSFGFSSSALSFNQKVQIIQDIKGLDSIMSKKLMYLMNIRNKFAHVQEINTFEDFFEIAKNGSQIKKHLEKWYSLDDKKDEDDKYKFLFFKLSEEITRMLWKLQIEERKNGFIDQMETFANKIKLEILTEEVLKIENGDKLYNSVLEKVKNKIENKDFITKK